MHNGNKLIEEISAVNPNTVVIINSPEKVWINFSLLIRDFNNSTVKRGIPLKVFVNKNSNILLSTTFSWVPYCFNTEFLKWNIIIFFICFRK